MGYPLNVVIDLAQAHGGQWAWDEHATVMGLRTVMLTLPGRTDMEGIPAEDLDESALALLMDHFPARVRQDPLLASLVEYVEAARC